MILIVNNKEMHRITALDLSKANYICITKSNELRINFSLDEPDIAVKLPELDEEQKKALILYFAAVAHEDGYFELDEVLEKLKEWRKKYVAEEAKI